MFTEHPNFRDEDRKLGLDSDFKCLPSTYFATLETFEHSKHFQFLRHVEETGAILVTHKIF